MHDTVDLPGDRADSLVAVSVALLTLLVVGWAPATDALPLLAANQEFLVWAWGTPALLVGAAVVLHRRSQSAQ